MLAGDRPPGGDLVEQRLEEVEVTAVEESDAHRRSAQRPGCIQSAEAAPTITTCGVFKV